MGLAKKLFLEVEEGRRTMTSAQKIVDWVFGDRTKHEDSLFHITEKKDKDNG